MFSTYAGAVKIDDSNQIKGLSGLVKNNNKHEPITSYALTLKLKSKDNLSCLKELVSELDKNDAWGKFGIDFNDSEFSTEEIKYITSEMAKHKDKSVNFVFDNDKNNFSDEEQDMIYSAVDGSKSTAFPFNRYKNENLDIDKKDGFIDSNPNIIDLNGPSGVKNKNQDKLFDILSIESLNDVNDIGEFKTVREFVADKLSSINLDDLKELSNFKPAMEALSKDYGGAHIAVLNQGQDIAKNMFFKEVNRTLDATIIEREKNPEKEVEQTENPIEEKVEDKTEEQGGSALSYDIDKLTKYLEVHGSGKTIDNLSEDVIKRLIETDEYKSFDENASTSKEGSDKKTPEAVEEKDESLSTVTTATESKVSEEELNEVNVSDKEKVSDENKNEFWHEWAERNDKVLEEKNTEDEFYGTFYDKDKKNVEAVIKETKGSKGINNINMVRDSEKLPGEEYFDGIVERAEDLSNKANEKNNTNYPTIVVIREEASDEFRAAMIKACDKKKVKFKDLKAEIAKKKAQEKTEENEPNDMSDKKKELEQKRRQNRGEEEPEEFTIEEQKEEETKTPITPSGRDR